VWRTESEAQSLQFKSWNSSGKPGGSSLGRSYMEAGFPGRSRRGQFEERVTRNIGLGNDWLYVKLPLD